MQAVEGNALRITTPHCQGIKARPVVIDSAKLPIRPGVQVIDLLLIVSGKEKMPTGWIPGYSRRFVRHGNHRRSYRGYVGRVDHVPAQGQFPHVGPLKVGDPTHGFFNLSVVHDQMVAGCYVSQPGWVRAGWIEANRRHVGGPDQGRCERAGCRRRQCGEGQLHNLARALGGRIQFR